MAHVCMLWRLGCERRKGSPFASKQRDRHGAEGAANVQARRSGVTAMSQNTCQIPGAVHTKREWHEAICHARKASPPCDSAVASISATHAAWLRSLCWRRPHSRSLPVVQMVAHALETGTSPLPMCLACRTRWRLPSTRGLPAYTSRQPRPARAQAATTRQRQAPTMLQQTRRERQKVAATASRRRTPPSTICPGECN